MTEDKNSICCSWYDSCTYYMQCEHLYNENKDLSEDILRLEQENENLYEEKNCQHKIIDRLLENAGYSKDIASAEDFEDVYEDMQIKRNELIELEQENFALTQESQQKSQTICELEQENKELKAYKDVNEDFKKAWDELNGKYKQLRSVLEEIRVIADDTFKVCDDDCGNSRKIKLILDKIEEVLNHSEG